MSAPRHVLTIADLKKSEILSILKYAVEMKKNPGPYGQKLTGKVVLCMYEKPSLRTRVSLEAGVAQLGGSSIFFDISTSPLGTGKESPQDTMKVLSRMTNLVTARVKSRTMLTQFAEVATIPIINALDNWAHPMQMMADMLTILEKKTFDHPLKLAYCGDLVNNVTYDLMRTSAIMGWTISVTGPQAPPEGILKECEELAKTGGGVIHVETSDPTKAVAGADVVYTDSWMSYGVSRELAEERYKMFSPFKVTADLMKHAKPDAIFMNCLPADRNAEQTGEVLDGPQSVVWDQAENRLHAQKALILFLLGLMS